MSEEPGGVENQTSALRRHYHPLQKDYATFLKTSEETGGEYTLIEIEVAAGGGNAPTTTRPTTSISRCLRAPWR